MASLSHSENLSPEKQSTYLPAATLGALGVVYGDIGTSPLYALRECFHGIHAIHLTTANIFGVLSLIVWSLIIVISIKYAIFVLRADNKGEGGLLSLMSLASRPKAGEQRKSRGIIIALGLFGAALLYGDGTITPAISVLSAIEGLKIATPVFEPYVIMITVAILFALFSLQKRGTDRIGKVFGPIILLWFLVLAVLGIKGILEAPEIIRAINPKYAFAFLWENSWHGLVVLGSVVLVVTGGEALYADMGHFGRKPIQMGWFFVAFPSLVLQYFGQGALLLGNPDAVHNPFYLLAPHWALYPLVVLATAATVIASQAMLTGAFSLSQQAVHLGYLPRIEIKHTSADEKGQIYVPFINWMLFIGTVFLVLEFHTSSSLAAAYGIAVTAAMVITTLLAFVVMRRRWKWPLRIVVPLITTFLVIDLGFLGANILKIPDGGWFPLVLAMAIFVLMTTWKRGREILAERLIARSRPLESFLKDSVFSIVARVPGAAVFMSATPAGTPSALAHNVKHNQVLHETIIILTVLTEQTPHVDKENRLSVETLGHGFFRVIAHHGFMESPNVPNLIAECAAHGLKVDRKETTFFLGRETLIATSRPGMALWRERVFVFMSRNAQRPTDYFQIPSDQVIEIGTIVEM